MLKLCSSKAGVNVAKIVVFLGLFLAALAGGPRQFRGLVLDIHTYFYGAVFVTAGAQAFLFGVFAKIFAFQEGLIPSEKWLGRAGRWGGHGESPGWARLAGRAGVIYYTAVYTKRGRVSRG
jgi:hypothetical protein